MKQKPDAPEPPSEPPPHEHTWKLLDVTYEPDGKTTRREICTICRTVRENVSRSPF